MYPKAFNVYSVIALLLLLQGCSTVPLTPSQTAQHFWGALLADDADTASRFSSPSSGPELTAMHKELVGATVSFGNVRIASEQASIETTLEMTQQEASPETNKFTTYLKRVNDNWRVDLAETKHSLDQSREKHGLTKLVDDLEKLGQDITSQLNEAKKNWEAMQPEIKQDLQNLGESIQQDVEGAINRYGPEIEQKLQDLNDSLEQALKELEKAVPQSPQQEPEERPLEEQHPEGRMI